MTGRNPLVFALVLASLSFGVRAATAQAIPPNQVVFDPMISPEMRSDARLNDVCFVSPRTGWAVGDRGTIWHTDDGGTHWTLQRSGVSCPIASVSFLDERRGWAAGGFSHPYRASSAGVILATDDGGRTWTRASRLLLPKIREIRFFDEIGSVV